MARAHTQHTQYKMILAKEEMTSTTINIYINIQCKELQCYKWAIICLSFVTSVRGKRNGAGGGGGGERGRQRERVYLNYVAYIFHVSDI